jgi:group I intron endonuclease
LIENKDILIYTIMNTNRDFTNVKGYIYKITSPNGDVYIGQTIDVRKRKHAYKKEQFKKQTKLWRNCFVYNWNPVDTFEIIDECLCGHDKIYLNEREIYWIYYYDSKNKGLNCTEGGKGQVGKIWSEEERNRQSQLINEMYEKGEIKLNPLKGHNLSEEHKNKIKQSSKEYFLNNEHWNTGKEISEEVKQKIIASTSGENNHFYGKKHSEEAKQKMKITRAKQIITEEHKNKIRESMLKVDQSNYKKHTVSVSQYGMDGNFICKYNSIKEAAEKTGSRPANITRVCKGRRKSSNNFIWKYDI